MGGKTKRVTIRSDRMQERLREGSSGEKRLTERMSEKICRDDYERETECGKERNRGTDYDEEWQRMVVCCIEMHL